MNDEKEIKHKWVKIGTHLFDIEDMRGAWIQKAHLVIELEYKHGQVVYHFKNSYNCEDAFNALCEAKEALIIETTDANFNPDIMKTFYGDQFDKQIKMMRCYEIDQLKVRHQKKLVKLEKEMHEMKIILGRYKKKHDVKKENNHE